MNISMRHFLGLRFIYLLLIIYEILNELFDDYSTLTCCFNIYLWLTITSLIRQLCRTWAVFV